MRLRWKRVTCPPLQMSFGPNVLGPDILLSKIVLSECKHYLVLWSKRFSKVYQWTGGWFLMFSCQGFPGYYYPYHNQDHYVSPLVWLQFRNIQPGMVIQIRFAFPSVTNPFHVVDDMQVPRLGKKHWSLGEGLHGRRASHGAAYGLNKKPRLLVMEHNKKPKYNYMDQHWRKVLIYSIFRFFSRLLLLLFPAIIECHNKKYMPSSKSSETLILYYMYQISKFCMEMYELAEPIFTQSQNNCTRYCKAVW